MQEAPLAEPAAQHDFNSAQWGLDTPSKFLESNSPNPWPSTGFTPSLFASLGSRGFTPSGLTPSVFGGGGAPDPHFSDYFSFGGGSSGSATKRNSVAGSLDGGAGAEEGVGGFGGDEGFPGFSRKRALSSPAIFTPGGGANAVPFPFARAADQHAGSGLNPFAPPKRPRLDVETGSSSSSSQKRGSVDDATPESSMVLTPPDSAAPLPSIDPFAFNKGGYTDDRIDPYSFDLSMQPGASIVSVSTAPAHLPPAVATPGIPHSTYQQFSLPLPADQLPHQPYLYELEEQRLAYAANAGIDLKPDPKVLSSAGSPAKKGAAAKGGKAGGRKAKKAISEDEEEVAEEKTAAEKEKERKDFLERNRLAACKSRKKKKERVGQLEGSASELAAQAAAQQVVALSLRREVAQLRQQINAHDGCSCEHIKGYLTRELSGGGIPTIDSLAGRVFTIDYSNVPSMGSEDDCYRDVFEPPPEAAALLATAGKKNASKARRTSVAKAPAAQQQPAASRPGIATRRSTISASTVDFSQPNAAFEQAVNDHAFSTTRPTSSFSFGAPIPIRTRGNDLPALPTLPSINQYDMVSTAGTEPQLFVRANSAPAVTPQWEFGGGGGAGSYFPVPA
ncbi:hypothetical protein BCR35DRAFT_311244 [Leucosporidium creatinivorum]|uniref:BZIP domain-containing protein n=1 Tax=Leucosporidium creatinivorum TaxID=106004 RepID=A0A1Y2C7H7_9BASI|nr:hypothetical protein BCR35DRAFT_311244 [Leucosporidium creatinivorum]